MAAFSADHSSHSHSVRARTEVISHSCGRNGGRTLMGKIEVRGIGKAYKLYPTRWARLYEWLDPRKRPRHSLKWVLRDLSFTVEPGEAIGLIGVNGAGKSTLLKIITG